MADERGAARLLSGCESQFRREIDRYEAGVQPGIQTSYSVSARALARVTSMRAKRERTGVG